jgi:DNA-binding NarL/FixJ family response regulator
MSRDLPDERIAEKLGISVRTVRYDISAIMAALGVRSRFAAGLRCADLPARSGDEC